MGNYNFSITLQPPMKSPMKSPVLGHQEIARLAWWFIRTVLCFDKGVQETTKFRTLKFAKSPRVRRLKKETNKAGINLFFWPLSRDKG
jgi:hypothetical protein